MNAEREAWREIAMMKYQLSGDMLKAAACADELISKLKRFFLHEAAEKQRQFRDEQYWPLEFKAEKRALNGAIDLIDPEVRS